MSMIGHLRAVTPAELKTLHKDPGSVRQFLHGRLIANSDRAKDALFRVQEMAMRAMADGTSKHNEGLREQILAELESARAIINPANEKDLCLEKSWHCLHYLLTGSATETDSDLGQAILGGKEIGPDIGYGPARYLDPSEVKKVANALKSASKKDLALRFDLSAMKKAEIYACREESELELAQEYFVRVCKYYEAAALRGDAMLLYLD
jgi:hypothetical protein